MSQTIKIFLASSSELKSNREAFEQFLSRRSTLWTKQRRQSFELLIWENFLDSVSKTRLQDEYNAAIRESDIFVMLFWNKVGLYTHEEFEVAYQQFQATGKPQIYTYFNSSSSVTPPDPSLDAFEQQLQSIGHFKTVYPTIEGLIVHFIEQLERLYPPSGGFASKSEMKAKIEALLKNGEMEEVVDTLLKVVVDRNESGKRTESSVDPYEMLCELDFKLQSEHFKLHKYKKIAAFLLHGKQEEDVRWLCNQLLYKQDLLNEKYILIDLGPLPGGAFDRILNEFYSRYEIAPAPDPEERMVELRAELEKRLKLGPIVCIIKRPEKLFNHKTELDGFFDGFLHFLKKNVAWKKFNNPIIFLFVEQHSSNYACRDEDYFLWYKDADKHQHFSKGEACHEPRIIDLAPIQKIEKDDIGQWIKWSRDHRPIYDRLKQYSGQEHSLLTDGDYPFQVIQKICQDLNIKIEEEWIR